MNGRCRSGATAGGDPASALREACEHVAIDPRVRASRVEDDRIVVQIGEGVDPAFLPQRIVEGGWPLAYFAPEPFTLEDAFLALAHQEGPRDDG